MSTREPYITRSSLLHILFLLIFILAFFPSLFLTVLYYPFTLLTPARPAPNPSPPAPTLCSPNMPGAAPWTQKTITLDPSTRGCSLVTDQITHALPELRNIRTGLLHLFAQHTSCGLTLNENWDSDVREDMAGALDRMVPEDRKGNLYRHSVEGLDDMPAHVKSSLVGVSVSVPVREGRLALGTWQGIWYCEFRDGRQSRRVVATLQGELM